MMRTANPALNAKTFELQGMGQFTDTMTIQGTVTKTFFMLMLLILTACWPWSKFFSGQVAMVMPMMWGGLIGGLIVAIILIIKKTWAPVLAPAYAVLEGLVLGSLSAIMEARFPGIVIQAVGLTFGTLFVLLFLYKARIIRATENFKLGIVSATGAIFLVYIMSWILGLFGINMPLIHSNGIMGILFSLFVVTIAALNLVLDFDFIERGSEHGAPKFMEWYAAFGLMVTLIWLYIEILRLLSKLYSRR